MSAVLPNANAESASDSFWEAVGTEAAKQFLGAIGDAMQWKPGTPHRTIPHVVAAEAENSWRPAPGYLWDAATEQAISLTGKLPDNPRTEWTEGLRYPGYPNLVSSSLEGYWRPANGFGWASDDETKLEVVEPEYVGLGMVFDPTPAYTGFQIRSIFPDSPAAKLSLRRGMVLRSVDGIDTKDRTIDSVLALLKGTEGQTFLLVFFDPLYGKEDIVKIAVGKVRTGKTDRSIRSFKQ
ncbi:MAG: hypothetical protein N838_33360 [Thiohalocapsa sp. PB-PSB1]|nr:MAG: hypothetical protein N838_33360 [Thiohalocapsa sp. PB-PSB1]